MNCRKVSLLAFLVVTFFLRDASAELKLITPAGYLPNRPFPVRIEVLTAFGERDRDLWDGEVVLSIDQPGAVLSTNRIALRNGLGTALLTITGNVPITLRATVGEEEAVRAVRNRTGELVTTVTGTLSGTNSTWGGLVNVTGNVLVPAGLTLTINPGTFVMINGMATGTNGIAITVNGAVQSLGTEQFPVTITSDNALLNWGQIRHESSSPSLYRNTLISKAGLAPGEGHTFTGPAFWMTNSALTLESCLVSDLTTGGTNIGKIMFATGSSLDFNNSVFARARMGPELLWSGLICTNSYFMEMHGPDDGDGIYLHDSGGQPLLLTKCVFVGGDDDAVDTLRSRVTIENCIIRDWANPNEDAKGVSGFAGEVILRHCLLVNCFEGVTTKTDGALGVLRIDHCTIDGIIRGVSAGNKYNALAGNLEIYITNSIVRAADALHSDFGDDRFVTVTYSSLTESWPGVGNITSDPLFMNAAAGNFQLQPGSPCINAAAPAALLDRDFSRSDIGAYSAAGELPTAPPIVSMASPIPGESVSELNTILVTFSAPVVGVNASDLRINNLPASSVIGSGAGPYQFLFSQPPAGVVQVNWAVNHGIVDVLGKPLATRPWKYVLEPGQAEIVINEIMYHPASENSLEEYVELHNRGSTAVNLNGWRFSEGVNFTFPDVTISPGDFLVVVADRTSFEKKYPGIANVIGNWTGALSNSREDIDLDDNLGNRIDSVRYADEGGWAVRQRGLLHFGQRGWDWFAEHDGLGKSAELIDPFVSTDSGQNWTASLFAEGTPGRVNSVLQHRSAPIIINVAHSPTIPKSIDSVVVTATVSGSATPVPMVSLNYRIDRPGSIPNEFQTMLMMDNGQNGDAFGGDAVFSAVLPAQTNNTVVEFYIEASDALGNKRSWPIPAIPAPEGGGPFGQVANALYQVDDAVQSGTQPLYKIIMTAAERATLEGIGSSFGGSANSDAEMNATFISVDGTSTELHYLASVRNRGHGSRAAKPNNFRVNFRSDEPWKNVLALNLNAQFSWLQVLGAALHTQSGSVGAYSRAVQFRVNNANVAFLGGTERTFGSYAANEVIDADWADRHFPKDSNGNVYRAIRDLLPPNFDYRVSTAYPALPGPEDKNSYTNTWSKSTNESEDDWSDLIAMLRVLGPNGTHAFTTQNAERVIDVQQWLLHLAIMNLLGNSETGLNTGHNDDYFMYRGVADPRFKLVYYDLDQILGFNNSYLAASQLFSAAQPNGAGQAIGRLLQYPDILPHYHDTLRHLLETSFSAENFDALVDQMLGDFVPEGTRQQIKNYMSARRTFVLGQLPSPAPIAPRAVVSAAPRSPTPKATATFYVSGEGVTHYRYSLDGAPFTDEMAIANPILLSDLANGTHLLRVVGRDTEGLYQQQARATELVWVVITHWPTVRLNEVLASRTGNLPDQVELYNEGAVAINMAGLTITDDLSIPNRFAFGSAILESGAYLVVDANQLGFALSSAGEGLYLHDSKSGAVLDKVEFGQQLPNLSIGRVGENGAWHLMQPSFGAANLLQPMADARAVKINEWHTAGLSPYADDFVELYNPEALPVAIGGGFLTDQRVGAPMRSPIAALTFIAPRGYVAFTSGSGNNADEINFALPAEQGQISLFDANGSLVDSIIYGPQRLGVSSGRCPDGAAQQKALQSPTPGGGNDCPYEPPPPQRVVLVPFNQEWKYETSGAKISATWLDRIYDDRTWSSGLGALGFDSDALPEPLRTTFQNSGAVTVYFRSYFPVDPALAISSLEVTHMIDDGAAFYLNGQEIGTRFNLMQGADSQTEAISSVNNASFRTFTIPATGLLSGTNVLAVEVHQASPNNPDLVMGLQVAALVLTNPPGAGGVVINELLADNSTFRESDGSARDWVELYNPSADAVDLMGMSLTDSASSPVAWLFPAGSIIQGKGFLRILCSSDVPASSTNTGFALSADGGALFLYNAAAQGGTVQSSITYGLQAKDWSIGRIPDGSTNWVLNIPTDGMANRAASLGNPALLKVNEWMADPGSGQDWFEIFNPNPEPVQVSGLWLSDDIHERDKTILPTLSFVGNAASAFKRFEADELPGANHVGFKLGAGGDSVVISFPTGALIDTISFGAQSRGVSQGRLLDGSTNFISFPLSPSPGSPNYRPLQSVVLNEVLTHTAPPFMDAVEFFNPTVNPVALGGWFLSDSPNNLRKYQIPDGVVVPANGFAVVYEDDFNGDAAGEPFSFSSANGDEVYLSESVNGLLTGYRAAAEFGAAENGVSFGRFPTSAGYDFVPLSRTTFGRDNPATAEEFKLGTGAPNAAPKIGPIVISEIMYHPPGANDALEYLELHNISPEPVMLQHPTFAGTTWRLRKGVEFEFASGTVIPAGGWLVVVNFNPETDNASRAIFEQAYGSTARLAGPYRGRLSNSGDVIELQKPGTPELDGSVPYLLVDRISYLDTVPWPTQADGFGSSLQKINRSMFGNDAANWIAAVPTPGPIVSNDNDTDGMPNDWETLYGLNPDNDADAVADNDGDGLENLHEFLAGTNPRNAADALRLAAEAAGAETVLSFSASLGRSYMLLYSDSATGPWQELEVIPSGPSSIVRVTDPSPRAARRFYLLQVVIQQP